MDFAKPICRKIVSPALLIATTILATFVVTANVTKVKIVPAAIRIVPKVAVCYFMNICPLS